jgi:hypothetical protein
MQMRKLTNEAAQRERVLRRLLLAPSSTNAVSLQAGVIKA